MITFESAADICEAGVSTNRRADCGVLASYDISTAARVDTLTPLPAIPGGGGFSPAFGFSGPDHLYALPTQGHETAVWDLNSGEQAFTLPGGEGVNAVITADGRQMFSGHVDGTVKVWDLVPTTGLRSLGDLGRHTAVSVDTIVHGEELGAFVSVDPATAESRVFFFDRDTGELVGTPVDGQQPVLALAHGRFMVTAPFPGAPSPSVWFAYDPMTQESVRLAGCEPDPNTGLCDSGEPPPFYFWAPSADGSELLRTDFRTGEFARINPGDGSKIDDLAVGDIFGVGAFSDEWVGGAGREGILVIDRDTGDELTYINQPCDFRNEISADWKVMAFACDDSVLMLDIETWEDWRFEMDLGRVQHVAIDTDANRIAMADEVGAHVFDYTTGEHQTSVQLPGVTNLAWLDVDHLLVGTATGSWAEISLLAKDLITAAKESVTRSFTDDECATYRIDPCPSLEEMRLRQ